MRSIFVRNEHSTHVTRFLIGFVCLSLFIGCRSLSDRKYARTKQQKNIDRHEARWNTNSAITNIPKMPSGINVPKLPDSSNIQTMEPYEAVLTLSDVRTIGSQLSKKAIKQGSDTLITFDRIENPRPEMYHTEAGTIFVTDGMLQKIENIKDLKVLLAVEIARYIHENKRSSDASAFRQVNMTNSDSQIETQTETADGSKLEIPPELLQSQNELPDKKVFEIAMQLLDSTLETDSELFEVVGKYRPSRSAKLDKNTRLAN